jgi:hypothetical protein
MDGISARTSSVPDGIGIENIIEIMNPLKWCIPERFCQEIYPIISRHDPDIDVQWVDQH